MTKAYDRYLKRLGGTPDAIRLHRRMQNDFNNNISFRMADGFKEAQILPRSTYDGNSEEWEDFEILLKHTQKEDKKRIVTRTGVDIPVGTYVKYGDNILIVSAQVMDDQDVMPSYSCYKCMQKLYLEGCPYVFPLYTSNSSYSAKGVADVGSVEIIDSRNKAYVQRNKFTVRFFEHHKNYRIAIGDEEVKNYYTVTQCDDSSHIGMFAITLKADERHPNDRGMYAYNDNLIDFSDLIPSHKGDEMVEGNSLPTLFCDTYQKKNQPFEVVCSNPIDTCEVEDGLQFISLSADGQTITVLPYLKGIGYIRVVDINGQSTSKKIVVKE